VASAAPGGNLSSRREYERRIHRVIAHIDAHLDGDLSLETLAVVAHFSPFHFHRLFRAWTGETVGDYLRRRRVELAAVRLVAQPGQTVLAVALSVGFGSGEAFARAFRQRFGASPTAWRHEHLGKPGQAESKIGQAGRGPGSDHEGPSTPDKAPTMNVTLIDREPTPVAYFRHTGPYGASVERFWKEQVAPWMAQNDLFGRPRFGIALDDPTVTEAARCRYDAGVEVPADAVLAGQAQRSTLPGGRFACMPFEGTSAEVDAAWQRLLRDWLPASGLQVDSRPFIEHYPPEARFDPATGVFNCTLCLPVTAL